MIPPLRILLAAFFGSASGGLTWYLIAGSPSDARLFEALAAGSILFTLPGSLMLFALEHILLKRARPRAAVSGALLATGAVVGGLVLGLIGIGIYSVEGPDYTGYVVGAVYGALTAIPLLVLKPPA